MKARRAGDAAGRVQLELVQIGPGANTQSAAPNAASAMVVEVKVEVAPREQNKPPSAGGSLMSGRAPARKACACSFGLQKLILIARDMSSPEWREPRRGRGATEAPKENGPRRGLCAN